MLVDLSALPDNAHYIGGNFVRSHGEAAIPVFDPATGEQIKEIVSADAADIDQAVAAARSCFDSRAWRKISPTDRTAAMWKFSDNILEHIDEFVELEIRDNGMTKAMAKAAVISCANSLRYYAGMVQKIHGQTTDLSTPDRELLAYTSVEPVGVVGAITPWNAPLAVLVNKIAPAIAAGCSVICKPAEQTPLSAIRLGQLLAKWRLFPDGLINIVNGYGHVAGAALADHPGVDKITFTGSTAVGKKLVQAAAGNLKRVTLELGGKSPVFIFNDANLETAIQMAAGAIFFNSGQVCYAGSRLYVQHGVYDQVVEGVSKIAGAMKLGNGMDESTQLGPLVSQEQLDRVLKYLEYGVSDGAELVFGGGREGDKGYFVKPAVFANRGRKKMRITEDEIFGPVVTAMPFDGLDELEALANDTPYGLGSGVFTSNNSTAHRAAKLIRAGNVWINCYHILDKAVPFGGFKQSGWGREMGFEGLVPFLETKAVFNML
jgi:acyl-CoA reductase-like NAD-dependent aldehyde dehydrogenase